MTEELAPLVSAEVNLRGLPWMRLETSRLLESDFYALSTGDEFKAALSLWCKSWSQQPAASLPTDDLILKKLSGSDTMQLWLKVKPRALHGWKLCSDGRMYHPVVAEQALRAWDERQEFLNHKDADAERKRREREDRSKLFAVLRAAGHTPNYKTPTSKLREWVDDVTNKSRVTSGDESHGQSHVVTDESWLREGKGEGEGCERDTSIGNSSTSGETEEGADDSGSPGSTNPGEMPQKQLSVAVNAAIVLRKIGARIQPQHPTLLALASENFTVEAIAMAAAEKVLRDTNLLDDPDMHPELHELLASGATQAQMNLTNEQHASVRNAAAEVGINYIAKMLRGRRKEAAGESHGSVRRTGTGTGNGNGAPRESASARAERKRREGDARDAARGDEPNGFDQ
ncbi:MAG: hypothetical protein WA777_18450 [Rhodanobacter sp.]